MSIEIKILQPGDKNILTTVAPRVFDRGIDPHLTSQFLSDPRHHLAVAIDGQTVIGFASAVHYVHPDKPPELWINEVAVAPTHRNRGVAKRLLRALLDLARTLDCTEAWVLTDRTNVPAMRLYASIDGAEAPRDQVMFTFKLK